jgi:RHS repeat-associated protein
MGVQVRPSSPSKNGCPSSPSFPPPAPKAAPPALAADHSGNVKEIREYSFAGALRRKTQLAYLHEANSNYVALNILDRMTMTTVYDGAGVLVAKSATGYDYYCPLHSASNAIRHDPAFGPSFSLRGLPTSTTRWYNLASNLSITSTVIYDECGNPREVADPKSYTSTIYYWLSAADNAYAFPLYMVNALGHVSQATYSYKSGQVLSQTDANGQLTAMTYETRDRIEWIRKTIGGIVKGGARYIYSDTCNCTTGVTPSVEIRKYLSGNIDENNTNYIKETGQIDMMGRLLTTAVADTTSDIKTDRSYGNWGQANTVTTPYRAQAPYYNVTYGYNGLSFLGSVQLAEGGSITYSYSNKKVTVTNTDGKRRKYTYQEDGKVAEVLEEDDSGNLTVATTYNYDAMGRLITVVQGVQTRSFTYDNLSRLLSETHPESGTATYTYDYNSNLLSKTDARGISTIYTYDELNRVTQKTYSDTTPSVSYYYDYAPPGSPISILNPVGRLTRVSTTTGSVIATNYYSYCSCSSVDQEATVITDGITKTYVTTYMRNYLGGLTSMIYPNAKVVTYTQDSVGRETKVSTTVSGQNVDIVRSASYLGPAGQLSEVLYGIRQDYYYPFWLNSSYTFSPKTGRLTSYQTNGLRQTLNYGTPGNSSIQTGQIFDITDEYYPQNSQHYEYDRRGRLTAFWISPGRGDNYTRKITWTYDQYGNMTSMLDDPKDPYNCPSPGCLTQYNVNPATNRLISWQDRWYGYTASYDNAGNANRNGESFDAEGRLLGKWSESYRYDGHSRRLRKLGSSPTEKIYFIYSVTGQLLVEDNWTADTQKNQIYFQSQLVATHDQADYVRFLFKDYLGSVRSVVQVTPGGPDWTRSWQQVEGYTYLPFAYQMSGWPGQTPTRFTGKELDYRTELTYFGARYYDSGISTSPLRWISPDPITAHIYDPLSLNKYSYVRNDPVNKIDPNGRSAASFMCSAQYSYEQCGGDQLFWGGLEGGFGNNYGAMLASGYVPGMPAAMWRALQQYNALVQDAYENRRESGGDSGSTPISRRLSRDCIKQFSQFQNWLQKNESDGRIASLGAVEISFTAGMADANKYTISEVSGTSDLGRVHWYNWNAIDLDTENIVGADRTNAEIVVHEIAHLGFWKSHNLFVGFFARQNEDIYIVLQTRFTNFLTDTKQAPCDPFMDDR